MIQSEHKEVMQKSHYRLFIATGFFCFLFMTAGQVFASAKIDKKTIPQDLISLILIHQPYMNQSFLTANYNWAYIKNNFPEAKLDAASAIYKKENSNNETLWFLNEKKEVTLVTFKFDLAKWKGSNVEKKLLKQYKRQLNPEAFSHVPSDTRTITIKDQKNKFEFDVFFPVSDDESPSIRSVSIHTKIGDK